MRNLFFALAGTLVFSLQAHAVSCRDSHVNEFTLNRTLNRIPFATVPDFSKIKPEDFVPNLKSAIQTAQAEIAKIKETDKPSFENVVAPLERALQRVTEMKNLFDSMMIDSAEAHGKFDAEMNERTLDFQTEVYNDPILFKAFKSVDGKNLTLEQQRLLHIMTGMFKEQGLDLSPADRQTFAKLRADLTTAYSQFMKNIGSYNKKTKLIITDKSELDGIPTDIIKVMEANAKADNVDGYVLPIGSAATIEVRTYAKSEAVRKRIWDLARLRVYEHENGDNSKLIHDIARMRHQYANLLGYKSYAELAIEDRMIGSADNVHKLIRDLTDAYLPAAKKEDTELRDFVRAKTGKDLEPWDSAFFSDMLMKERYSFDEQLVREYLPTERVRDGLFKLLNQLWGLQFRLRTDMPVQHPDMQMYEMRARDGETLGFVQLDLYSREGEKKPGAWHYGLHSPAQGSAPRAPGFAKIAMNLTKPAAGDNSLMTLDQARTLFHEFGHGIHFMATRAKYSLIAGTATKHDFVELPSQFLEQFLAEPTIFTEIARHHKTGEKIPDRLVEAMIRAQNFQQALMGLGQIQRQLLDMAWNEGRIHDINKPLWEIENEVTAPASIRAPKYPVVMTTAFTHIMHYVMTESPKGGYGGGYYSYKYSDILAAQAFDVFKRHGLFDRAIADKYLRLILEPGDSVDPLTAFRDFTGENPNLDALLRRDGIR